MAIPRGDMEREHAREDGLDGLTVFESPTGEACGASQHCSAASQLGHQEEGTTDRGSRRGKQRAVGGPDTRSLRLSSPRCGRRDGSWWRA